MPTTTTGVATEFINFTRASNATVTDSNGLIDWAAHNLLLASEQFDASNWSKNAATVAANAIAAPNGTTTADTLTSTGSGCYVLQSYSAISGTITVSVFAKPGTNSSVVLRAAQAGNGYETSFTLSGSGTAGTPTIVGTGGTVSGMTAAISSLANSWYLCSITFAETGLGNVFIMQTATSGTIHLWGAHLYRSDLGGMQANTSAYPMYNPTTPKNLLGFTENFDNAAWSKIALAAFGSGSVSNAVVAPNGLQTADKIVADNTNARHAIRQAFNFSTGTQTISFYAKAAEYSLVYASEATSGNFYAAFNLASGAVISGNTGGPCYVASSASITLVGDGWYRCSLRVLNVAGLVSVTLMGYPAGATLDAYSATYTGDNTSGIYIWGAQLSDSASLDAYTPNHFTAPSAAAYYGPRRDFDGATLACKGLLVEELRSNLLLHSADFTQAAWTKFNLNTSGTPAWSNVAVAPDGTQAAEKLIANTTNSAHWVGGSATITSGVAYTVSAYVKSGADVGDYTFASLYDCNASTYIIVNLATGALVSGTASAYTITPVGSGWYRLSVTATSSSTTGYARVYLYDGTNTNFAGNDAKGIYAWGFQLELGSFATSYIPTTTASATRSADVAQVSTAAFPYSATEGTLVANVSSYGGYNFNSLIELNDGTVNNRIGLRYNSGAVASFLIINGGVSQATINPAAPSASASKFAAAYKASDFATSYNGGAASTASSGTVPTSITKMEIGNYLGVNTSQLNGHIRQITYIPRRLSNAELQARTV